MWPKLVDMSRDECKRLLRRLELEAYAGIISAFRAQGALTDEKKKMLNDLCNMLSISTERHRAEIRRAVNDEKFATVAEHLAGSNTSGEWAIEGRRLVPLLPRLVPQTVFTLTANQAANMAQSRNATLPPPAETARKEVATPPISSPTNVKPAKCPPSPNSSVVVLPSGLSIPIKSPSDLSDNDTGPPPMKRKRSESMGSSVLKSEPPSSMGGSHMVGSHMQSPKPHSPYGSMPSTSKITTGYVTQAMGSSPSQGSPVKITFTKGSGSPGQQSVPVASGQKVIIVSSGSTSYTPTILQRSQSLPASRALSTMSGSMHGGKQLVVLTTVAGQQHHGMMAAPGSSSMGMMGASGRAYTSTTSSMDPSMSSYPQQHHHHHHHPSIQQVGRPRPKTITKQKVVKPFSIIGGTSSSSHHQSAVHPGPSGVTMTTPSPTAGGKKPTIHIKQESAGVKIITQTIGNTGKIVPKPITIQTTSGGSVVMVTCVPSSMVMAGKPIVSSAGSQGGSTRTIYSPGTRYVTAPVGAGGKSGSGSNVITVSPRALQTALAKGAVPSTGSQGGSTRTIYSPGTRYVTAPVGAGGKSGSGSNVITVSPRALQTALAKGAVPSTVVVSKASGAGGHLGSGKANVIVVQKSQMLPKTVNIQRSLSSPEVQKHLLSGSSSLLTRPKISMVTTTASMTSSVMSPTVRFPVPPHQARVQQQSGVTAATSMTMTPVIGGQMQGSSGHKGPVTVGVIGGPKGGPDATSRAAQVVIRSKTSLSQPGQPTRRRSGSPASTHPFLEFPSQVTPAGSSTEGERLTHATVQRRSASTSPTLTGQRSPGMIHVEDSSAGVGRLPGKEGQVPMLFHTARQPNKEWIDYDGNPPEQSASSAIKALLEFKSQPQPQSPEATKQRQTSLDLSHMGRVPLSQAAKSPSMPAPASPSSQPGNRQPITQYITTKKGALTGPLPGPPMRPVIQRSGTPPTTTSSSVFTGSQSMMTAHHFQRKQDMQRAGASPFLQSASLEVEKALQEQNKSVQQHQARELSATLPQLVNPPRPPPIKVPPQQKPDQLIQAAAAAAGIRPQMQQPPKKPSIVTIEDQGVISKQVELSPAEVNSFIDQFERFLESEGLESEMEGSEKLAVMRAQKERAEQGGELLMPKVATMQSSKPVPPSTKPVLQQVSKPSVVDVESSGSSGLKSGSGASVSVGQIGSVSGSSVGLGPKQDVAWQDNHAQQAVEQTQKPIGGQSREPTSTSTTLATIPESSPAVTVESVQKPFSTLHEMLSKGKSTSVEPIVSVGQAKPTTSVVVESSRFDTSQMKMEDFTSQRLQDDFHVTLTKQDDVASTSSSPTPSQKSPARSEGADIVAAGGSGSQSEDSLSLLDSHVGTRSSKRKRKAPVPIDEDIGPMCMPSWARAALNLLHRVMRFRGANRSKGDLNAASWFTRPVDPSEAPGYMQLIKTPMDFSTIKKKLENNQYNDLSEFHNDMMLVRGNCHLYNPPGHEARKDCEEVFQFYTAEYGKVLDRMQKALLFGTPKSPKKTKDGSSPVPSSPTKTLPSSSS